MIDGNPDIDVLIIGAGISGLVTAYKCLKKDSTLKILIVEASHRIGGQIYSKYNDEFGAKWINIDQKHVRKLCHELDIQIVRTSKRKNKRLIWDIDKGIFGSFAAFEFDQFVRKINLLSKWYSLGRFPDNLTYTMEEYLSNNVIFPAVRNVIRLIIRASCGIDANSITFGEYLAFSVSTKGITNQFNCLTGIGEFYEIIPNNYEIIKKLSEYINPNICILNTEVTSIMQYQKCAIVSTANDHQFRVSFVVVAIPFEAIENIYFKPNLVLKPNVASSKLNHKSMNMTSTFLATYANKISELSSDSDSKVWFITKPEQMIVYKQSEKTLFGILYHTDRLTKNLLQEKILKQIKLSIDPVKLYKKSWKQSLICSNNQLTNPWYRIIWASTNVDELQFRGYLNGSIQSGMNAALIVLSHLKPQLINWRDYDDVSHANVISPDISVIEQISTLFNFNNILQCSIGIIAIIICRALYFKRIN